MLAGPREYLDATALRSIADIDFAGLLIDRDTEWVLEFAFAGAEARDGAVGDARLRHRDCCCEAESECCESGEDDPWCPHVSCPSRVCCDGAWPFGLCWPCGPSSSS